MRKSKPKKQKTNGISREILSESHEPISRRATIVGDPVVDVRDKRIVYSIELGGAQGNAWEYKDTGEAALAMVNFELETIMGDKRALIRSAVVEWRAANRDKYAGLLGQL